MSITGRVPLLAALGALAVGLLLPSLTGVLAVNLLLLLAIVCDLLLAAPVRELLFTRSGDTTVRVGEEALVDVVVINRGSRPLRSRIRDAWPPSALPDGGERHGNEPSSDADQAVLTPRQVLTVPPRGRRAFTTRLRPSRRGDHHAGPLIVRSFGPLGLAARQGRHHVGWTVRALPPFAGRRHLPAKLARLRGLDGRTTMLGRGQGTEFDSLRSYLPGDDTRSIDWRATARLTDVAVRVWRPERDRQLLIVLDTGRTAAARVGDAPRLDAFMDAALLLASLAVRAGDRVDLMAYDREVRALVRGHHARDALPTLINALAPLEAALVETDARGLAMAALKNALPGTLIVLLTSLDAPALEEGLLPVLPLVTHRRGVLLAAVSDPRVDVMAESRGDAAAVYEAAAALGAQSERQAMTEQLRRHGVTVVDAPPAAIGPAVADAYLTMKRTGRL
ncbi:DUF58 domain-containing protein [Streptomyces sp. NPDC018031]|uniref:DUF58 domain-containing protein n=1 Tax=Streptomyces sp. NPDC018031 TaxID=3365033 RepID=UPI0037B8D492